MDYTSINDVLKKEYGQKVYRISLDAGMTCPNRDGTLGMGGCIFCSEGGSGDFAESRRLSIAEQLKAGKEKVRKKVKSCNLFIAYFQAYTNTYASIDYLRKVYYEALEDEEVAILSIATRPDCLNGDVLALLKEINEIKPIWVELGLQTINQTSVEFINRGYKNVVYKEAVQNLNAIGIKVITHLILYLPNETIDDMLASLDYAVECGTWGIKLQLLHVLKGTRLHQIYEKTSFYIPSLEEYTDTVIKCLKRLPEEVVVHRITGDGPKKLLVEPTWTADKKRVLNYMNLNIKDAECGK